MKKFNSKFNIIVLISVAVLILGVVLVYNYLKISAKQQEPSSESSELGSIRVKGPRLEVSPVSFDFGTVVYGDVAKHTFELKNIGSEPLEILRLSTSCGCTKAEVAEQDKIIKPGQSVEMEVSFDPAVHKDDADLGAVTRIVYIKTNDLENPEVEVEIRANVITQESGHPKLEPKVIQVTARQWSFEPNPIRVKQGDLVRLEITSIDVTHGFTLPNFNINEMIEPGKKVVVEFLADKVGTFDFFCSVPCGPGHSNMRGQLIVE